VHLQSQGQKLSASGCREHEQWRGLKIAVGEIQNPPVPPLIQALAHVAYFIFNHYGGRWHVTVTNAFRSVDLRKFEMSIGYTTYKPTDTKIALSITECSS